MFRSPRFRLWSVLILLLGICGGLTALHKRAQGRDGVDHVTSSLRRYVLAPPARGIQAARSWWTLSISAFFSGPRLARENRSLRRQVAVLSQQTRDLQDEQNENQRLRALLNFKGRSSMTLLPAQVLALKPTALRDTLTLSRGLRDGVRRKMAVLDPSGALVGQVIDVTTDTCDVLLLTDDLSSVGSVMVAQGRPPQAKTIVGLAQGDRSNFLKLIDIAEDADIRPGDQVITSGLGGIYPKDIPIGTVQSVSFDKATYLKQARIGPAADFNHLQEAFLLLAPEN